MENASMKCFVLSPIGEDDSPERTAADKVLRHLIKKGLGDGYLVERADDNTNPGAITPQIVASILAADLIVADLSGFNANVFYELAIAHGFGKPTVHIQRKGERPPFDVKDMRIVRYDMDPDELEKAQKLLKEYAKFAVETPGAVETPLTSAQRFAAVTGSTDPVAESNVRVMAAIESLHKDVRRALPRRRSSSEVRVQEDNRVLRSVVARVVDDARADESDFAETITQKTSTAHDDWVAELFKEAFGEGDDSILYHPDLDLEGEENSASSED